MPPRPISSTNEVDIEGIESTDTHFVTTLPSGITELSDSRPSAIPDNLPSSSTSPIVEENPVTSTVLIAEATLGVTGSV